MKTLANKCARKLAAVVVVSLLCITSWLPASIVAKVTSNSCVSSIPVLREVVVEAGPFDLQRRYLSMQGPLTHRTFQMRCLNNQKRVNLQAIQVTYLEGGHSATMTAQAQAKGQNHQASQTHIAASKIATAPAPLALYWFTGTKTEVIDEKNRVMPGSEFLCHVNIDAARANRGALFPQATPSLSTRLCTLTQGLTSIFLPEGFGVPFSSEDNFDVVLQAANRTTSQHRLVKLRCHVYFIADQDAEKPIQALSWANGNVVVQAMQPSAAHRINPDVCDDCPNLSNGWTPPNLDTSSVHSYNGQQVIGHWAVPCGVHRYRSPVLWPQFSSIGPIRSAWVHVHPFCQSFSLLQYLGTRPTALFTINCRTITSPGVVQLTHIDCIQAPQGIRLNQNAQYAMEVTYNNTSGKEQDSMASMGVFFSDPYFKKPSWAVQAKSL